MPLPLTKEDFLDKGDIDGLYYVHASDGWVTPVTYTQRLVDLGVHVFQSTDDLIEALHHARPHPKKGYRYLSDWELLKQGKQDLWADWSEESFRIINLLCELGISFYAYFGPDGDMMPGDLDIRPYLRAHYYTEFRGATLIRSFLRNVLRVEYRVSYHRVDKPIIREKVAAAEELMGGRTPEGVFCLPKHDLLLFRDEAETLLNEQELLIDHAWGSNWWRTICKVIDGDVYRTYPPPQR